MTRAMIIECIKTGCDEGCSNRTCITLRCNPHKTFVSHSSPLGSNFILRCFKCHVQIAVYIPEYLPREHERRYMQGVSQRINKGEIEV